MTYRLTKIYTRSGDQGYTSLRNQRISKDDLLVEAIGTIDELNAAIGLVMSHGIQDEKIAKSLTQIQNDLFDMGGELHLPEHVAITDEKVKKLEETLDEWNDTLPPLKEFVLPRGNPRTATAHLARTICRRAERTLVRLHRQVPLHNPIILKYVNRLSDLLFVVSRVFSQAVHEREELWDHERK